jgi:ABC-type glycerol-3-phosphate transport system permease component
MLLSYLFPGVILIIPLYKLLGTYKLINTPWGPAVVYVAFCAPFSVWLLESFFHAIPSEVEEAAVLEGASRMQVLRRIFVPLIAPGLVSIAIFTFIYAWSDYMFAVIFLNEESKMTLTIGLELFMSVVRMQWGLVAAGAVGAVLPVMVFFVVFGTRFIRNMTEGVIK